MKILAATTFASYGAILLFGGLLVTYGIGNAAGSAAPIPLIVAFLGSCAATIITVTLTVIGSLLQSVPRRRRTGTARAA